MNDGKTIKQVGGQMIFTTKKEFEKYFRDEIVPQLKEQERQYMTGVDVPLRRETWNNITDALVTEEELPRKAREWNPPW